MKPTPIETIRKTVNVKICSQADLCHAAYALYLAKEQETDPQKKAMLERVEDALHDITNHTGVDAIASDGVQEDDAA